MRCGVLVAFEMNGLPFGQSTCNRDIFAVHVHSGTECSGTEDDPFVNAMTHYNPQNCEHPYHAGDLPPIFGNHGYGLSIFMTDRFRVEEVLGRAVIVHANLDDFTTQPAGNAGAKIGCGVIEVVL
jgi:Cu-Zn family superoxide dismutase